MYLLYIKSYAVKQTGKPSIATQFDKPYNRYANKATRM